MITRTIRKKILIGAALMGLVCTQTTQPFLPRFLQGNMAKALVSLGIIAASYFGFTYKKEFSALWKNWFGGKPHGGSNPGSRPSAAADKTGKHAAARKSDPTLDALITAIEHGNLAAVQTIVPAQIPANAVTHGGRALKDIALHHKRLAVYLYLLQHQGTLNVHGKPDISKLLPPALQRDVVGFYHNHDWLYEFTNFAEGFPVIIGDKTWPTTEHYVQAQKFHDPTLQEYIRTLPTARAAFEAGRGQAGYQTHGEPIVVAWNDAKDIHMLNALRAKFNQYPILRLILVSLNKATLVEATEGNDTYWGVGADGIGRNRLGVCLMHVRGELQTNTSWNMITEPNRNKRWL